MNKLLGFGDVRQTINTPVVMAKQMDEVNMITDLALRYVDQQEYSLRKMSYIRNRMGEKKKERYTEVLDESALFFSWICEMAASLN